MFGDETNAVSICISDTKFVDFEIWHGISPHLIILQ
jgi:hypothetical protein